jgi:hypothetical protein
MNCRDTREALDALLDGELEPGEELAVREHLDACPSCVLELEDLRDWHGTLSDALAGETARPSIAERRRTAEAVNAAVRRPRIPAARWAALLAIGLSLGVAGGAVALSRPPQEQVARVVDRIRDREARDASLRAMSAEIQDDLGRAREAVAGRDAEDPAARAVEVASASIARRLGVEPPPVPADAGERVSITRTVDEATVTVTQFNDGRIRLCVPGQRVEARDMDELRSRYGDLCRRYSVAGRDGCLSVGDTSAGADWKGRFDLMFRTGSWDESAQWEIYRGWAAARARDAKEVERRLQAHQDRVRAAAGRAPAAPPPVDVNAILRNIKSLTRTELQRTQERIEAEMKMLEDRMRAAGELRERARGLRIFAEDVTRD